VANIGIRPTFDGTDTTTIEAHLLDYNGDIYGHTMRLDFIARLRDEHQFISADELVAQIKADIRQARELLAHASDVSQSK